MNITPEAKEAILAEIRNSGQAFWAEQMEVIGQILTAHEGERCVWEQGGWDMEDVWETACGQSYIYEYGVPLEHGANYCQHCGKPITEIEYEPLPPKEGE